MKIATVNRTQNGHLKFNLQNYPPAWRNVSGIDSSNEISKLRKKVAFFYRASKKISGAAAVVPYCVINRSGDIVTDSTNDFFNPPFLWLENYNDVIQLVVLSLIDNGAAYLLKTKAMTGNVLSLQYVLSESMTPKYKEDGELDYFERAYASAKSGRQIKERIELDELIYFWLPDSTVENQPPEIYDGKAAFSGADILSNMQDFKTNYFKNGMVNVGFMTYGDRLTRQESENIQSFVRRMMTGVQNAFKQYVLFRNDIQWQQIGSGLESLDNDSLTQTEQRDILAALGVPPDLVLPPSGGLDNDIQSAWQMFYQDTVAPIVDFIHQQLNKQLFGGDYKIVAKLKQLDIFAEDENKRAEQLKRLVDSGVDLAIAMELSGYPEDAISKQAAVNAQQAQMPQTTEVSTNDPSREDEEMKTLRNWCKNRKGKEAHPSDFKSDVLSFDTIANVMVEYELYHPPLPPVDKKLMFDDGLMKLHQMIESKTSSSVPQNITVNITPEGHTVNVEPSEIKADITVVPTEVAMPDVVVNVPEPNTTVNVQSPTVNVDNVVEFPKRMTETTTVKRNAHGLIESTESTSDFEE